MTFICAGYAMTEFPALLFLLFSILIINNLDIVKFNKNALCFLAGLCLSLAIAGRWNYLALLPIFWLWLFFKEIKAISILWFISSSLWFPIWIIYAWKGLVPPEARVVSGYTTFDIAPHHFILSGCFSALMILMLRPSWLFEMKKSISVFTYLSIGVFVSNSLLGLYSFLPAKSVFNRFASLIPLKEEMFASAFGSLSICLSLVFFYNLFLHIWKRKSDWNYVFYAVCVVVILLTSIKTTHIFSSRYPYQALPFLLLMLQYETKNETKWWEIALAAAGIGWGIMTWFSYQTIY
jgi:hypothetical protein